jgi:large subunit ribosomal protein L35
MPKIKTHKSTAKRFRRTGTGKLVRMYQGRGHLRRKKAPRTLVKYRQIEIVETQAAEKRITRLAPYLD